MFESKCDRSTLFRLLHCSGDSLIADRAEALDRLAELPGARLFVIQADRPAATAPALPDASQR